MGSRGTHSATSIYALNECVDVGRWRSHGEECSTWSFMIKWKIRREREEGVCDERIDDPHHIPVLCRGALF